MQHEQLAPLQQTHPAASAWQAPTAHTAPYAAAQQHTAAQPAAPAPAGFFARARQLAAWMDETDAE